VSASPSVILFDGVCNLCNAGVRFVIERDRAGRFQFAPLQSPAAARLLAGRGPDGLDERDTVVLVTGDRVLTRSSAALHVARGLGFPWTLLSALLVIPRPIRDWCYDWLARRRYRWFGKRETCMVPTPELRGRFLSD